MIPEDRKFPFAIWTKQPVRKIRMRPATVRDIEDAQRALGSDAVEFHGATKAGAYIIIPASNIAYFEVEELGRELE